MGMSTHIQAFRKDDDPTYQKHAKVLKACDEAGVEKLPKETAEYFGSDCVEPCFLEEALEIDLEDVVQEVSGDGEEGYEIRVEDIPEGVYKIRFTNSW